MNSILEAERHIASRLAAGRQLRGVSQDLLAQKLGVTARQLEDHEQGHAPLTAADLHAVARALQLEVSFFYEGLNGTTSCPFALSDKRYAALRHAVQRIAADHEITSGGCRKKLSLRSAVHIARDVCDTLGWTHGSQSDVTSRARLEQESAVATTTP